MTRSLLIAACVISVAPRVAAGDCAFTPLHAVVVTRPDATIPSDGGILVATTYEAGSAKDKDENAVRPGWRLRGKTLTAPKIDVLAPGLAVYRITFGSQTAPVELEDEDHKVVAKVTGSKAMLARLAPPKPTSIVYSATMSRHSSQSITATLDADAPAEAFAIVIADAKGNARSWGNVSKGKVQYPYSHSDCGMLPNGTNPPAAGDLVTLYWVTADGRRSEPSKPIKMVGKSPKLDPY